jgi:hypothetical protein
LGFEGQLDDCFRNLGKVLDMLRGLDRCNPYGGEMKGQSATEG